MAEEFRMRIKPQLARLLASPVYTPEILAEISRVTESSFYVDKEEMVKGLTRQAGFPVATEAECEEELEYAEV